MTTITGSFVKGRVHAWDRSEAYASFAVGFGMAAILLHFVVCLTSVLLWMVDGWLNDLVGGLYAIFHEGIGAAVFAFVCYGLSERAYRAEEMRCAFRALGGGE